MSRSKKNWNELVDFYGNYLDLSNLKGVVGPKGGAGQKGDTGQKGDDGPDGPKGDAGAEHDRAVPGEGGRVQ